MKTFDKPIEIDGSIGYGQVLRTAVALSVLTLKSVRIFNIRKGRPRPGLMPQHLTGVKIAAEFCSADVKGLSIGSMEVEFTPKEITLPLHKKIDIGTSGSIGLILQTLAPICIFAEKEVTLDIIGGTAGLGAPPIEYLQHVTFPVLSKLDIPQPEIEIIKQGFYPRGCGHVKIKFCPTKKLKAIELTKCGDVEYIHGISIAGKLPDHVAERQAKAAEDYFKQKGFDVDIERQTVQTLSAGTSITLWADCEHSVMGANNIGKLKVPAETIGKRAAGELYESIKSGAALDKFMSDQIIPFIALANGISKVRVEKITEHCQTNIRIVEKLLPVKFDINDRTISVRGVGLKL